MDNAERQRLRAQAQELTADLQVGKAGVTDAFIAELDRRLEENALVKIRLLASAREGRDRKEVATEAASRASAELLEVRGNTAVFFRARRKPKG